MASGLGPGGGGDLCGQSVGSRDDGGSSNVSQRLRGGHWGDACDKHKVSLITLARCWLQVKQVAANEIVGLDSVVPGDVFYFIKPLWRFCNNTRVQIQWNHAGAMYSKVSEWQGKQNIKTFGLDNWGSPHCIKTVTLTTRSGASAGSLLSQRHTQWWSGHTGWSSGHQHGVHRHQVAPKHSAVATGWS